MFNRLNKELIRVPVMFLAVALGFCFMWVLG